MEIDFSELDKLEVMLKEANIPYDRFWSATRGQIVYLSTNERKIISDVVVIYMIGKDGEVRNMSYGAPLLEQMGLIDENAVGDMVEGGLTAETVFERWEKHYNTIQKEHGVRVCK